ncbi:hypothetical protein AAFN85_29025 [Mucilaginibacter sp. CAU 1740]|uniref:hypothetical protein n=1 Tax=Mucilaginibacter sp. CAU 1740 TaxID=3140365 RepID=UPI00325B818E
MKTIKGTIFILLLLIAQHGHCQNLDRAFYLKFEAIANQEKSAARLYQRADSIKKTREPVNSSIKLNYNRDVGFGYTQQLISVTLNGTYDYHLILLTHNDTVCFSSVMYGRVGIAMYLKYDEEANIRRNHPKIDTTRVLRYLKLRNSFYASTKTITDLKNDLNAHERYSLYCGDAAPESEEARSIDSLVKRRDVAKLRAMLVSVCSETQAYALYGYRQLKRRGLKISKTDQRILTYLANRKTFLNECRGCFAGIFPTNGPIRDTTSN